RPRLGELDRRLDELVRLAVGVLELLVREAELLAELHDRVLRLPQLLDLALRPIHLRIADVVPREPVRLEEQEDRPASLARVIQSSERGAVDLLHILAV